MAHDGRGPEILGHEAESVALGANWRALLAVVLAMIGFGIARFRAQAARVHRIPERALRGTGTEAELARGRHLVTGIAGCTECHGAALAGRVMDENALMRVSAPNITPSGVVARYRDSDWVRAILHGVNPERRGLIVMPAQELRTFSDQDVMAMIAYLRRVPPAGGAVAPTRVSWLGQALLGLAGEDLWSAASIDHGDPRTGRTTPSGPTIEHGKYLVGVCKGCHGPELRGGLRHGPGAPPSADISPPAMAHWSREELERLLRLGKRRDGTAVSPAMPWRALGQLSDEELTAIWLALRN
jgi:cytochrome c553